MCGEKLTPWQSRLLNMGSPPRVRGKARSNIPAGSGKRITPACAGKSLWCSPACHRGRDHPRVCGEKAYNLVISGSEWGSPPRVRGKVIHGVLNGIHDRITPAYAGKRYFDFIISLASWDHPRVCGEKSDSGNARKPNTGSPPRMRGKDPSSILAFSLSGITPAYAGKSSF